jgi:hypothetical protein
MRRLVYTTITLFCLAILVPVLVIACAAFGLQPRHWSGITLADVQLPRLRPVVHWDDARNPRQDEVADALGTIPYGGWQTVGPGTDGLVHIKTTRISPYLFPGLGQRFSGDDVGVVYSPLEKRAQLATGSVDPYRETWWQRTDPVGSWITLAAGFPGQLALGLLLAACAWRIILRQRKPGKKTAAT